MITHSKTASTNGLTPIDFSVSSDNVDPIKNNVRFKPALATAVM